MSDRIFAAVWLVFSVAVAWLAWRIEAPFSYEPIGPRSYPILLAVAMAACSAWLFVRPSPEPDWPRAGGAGKAAILVGVFLAYALLFEWLGFPLATAIATMAIGRLFGGGWGGLAIGGLALGGGLWFFFDKLLDVTLPLGRVFSGA